MPTPMHVYVDIASRHGIDPKDESAIDEWYERVVPTLPLAKRQAILDELLDRDGEDVPEEFKQDARKYATYVPVPELYENSRVKWSSRK